jgi:putative flavoprotein involved in K+ transport
VIDAAGYRNERALPDGKVLVVGSGQTGCQLAEELAEAGREVLLSCGRAPWLPRRFGGRDLIWWSVEIGYLEVPVEQLASPAERLLANVIATGRGGGHDLSVRTLRASGVELVGRFLGCEGRHALFAADLGESVAWGDERYGLFRGLVERAGAERGLPDPELSDPEPFDAAARERVDLAGFGAVVFAGGYRPGYGEWLRVPGALDGLGFPLHDGSGASTAAPGLYFVGVHFLRKRKSSLLYGVGEDAALVAAALA